MRQRRRVRICMISDKQKKRRKTIPLSVSLSPLSFIFGEYSFYFRIIQAPLVLPSRSIYFIAFSFFVALSTVDADISNFFAIFFAERVLFSFITEKMRLSISLKLPSTLPSRFPSLPSRFPSYSIFKVRVVLSELMVSLMTGFSYPYSFQWL